MEATNLTTRQAAKALGTGIDRILDAIRCGDLAAFDIRSRGSKRATWRITEEALRDYIAARSTQPQAPKPAKRAKYVPEILKG